MLAGDVRGALSWRERARGLIARPPYPGSALIIYRGRQVHTFFMKAAIDVLFVDRDGRVLRIARSMQPWRVSRWVARTRAIVELSAGAAEEVKVGDLVTPSAVPRQRR